MLLISHRGNLFGKKPELENSPNYIRNALNTGFDVEIDIWFKNGDLFLGHDEPQYQTDLSFLRDNRLWCHAKNIEALHLMVENRIHCFWHQEDDVTLTSKGFLWTYPGKPLTDKSICVSLGKIDKTMKCYGICSDYIGEING